MSFIVGTLVFSGLASIGLVVRQQILSPGKSRSLDFMNERQPLPMGRKEFEEWSDRIISGAMIPGATPESQKFTLANLLLHLGPQESHKEDAFFIHSLRKFAVNQVADALRTEIRDSVKARLEKEEKGEALPKTQNQSETKVLAN